MRAAYALAIRVFVGVQPSFTHVPPNLWRSITAPLRPAAANLAASAGPAWPVPTTMASNDAFVVVRLRLLHDGYRDGIARRKGELQRLVKRCVQVLRESVLSVFHIFNVTDRALRD